MGMNKKCHPRNNFWGRMVERNCLGSCSVFFGREIAGVVVWVETDAETSPADGFVGGDVRGVLRGSIWWGNIVFYVRRDFQIHQ